MDKDVSVGRLEGKVCIITGGAGGIGRAAGRLFAIEGANVLLVDLDKQQLIEAVEDVGTNRVSYCVADVTKSEDNQNMVAIASERYGGVDILLANAGIEGDVAAIEDYDESRFDQVIAVNVKGPFLALQAVFPAMTSRGGGSVIISSSVAGVRGAANILPYATSKHAVIGMMKSAAREGASRGIRVNTVNPSPVETRMMRSLEEGMAPGQADSAKAQIEANIPMGRYAQPQDIAKVMLFLASDDSEFITGSVYLADGGSTA